MGWLAKRNKTQLTYPQGSYNSLPTSNCKAISSLCLTKTPLKDNIIISSRFLKHFLLPLKCKKAKGTENFTIVPKELRVWTAFIVQYKSK